MSGIAKAGTCYSCGYALVQATDDQHGVVERTYHPFNAIPKGESCAALIPIEHWAGTYLSTEVPPEMFLIDDEDRKLRDSLNRMEKEA
jgi:hypothetical protein